MHVRLVAVNPAGGGPATWIPPDGLRREVADEAGADAGPFTSDETGAPASKGTLLCCGPGIPGRPSLEWPNPPRALMRSVLPTVTAIDLGPGQRPSRWLCDYCCHRHATSWPAPVPYP